MTRGLKTNFGRNIYLRKILSAPHAAQPAFSRRRAVAGQGSGGELVHGLLQ